MRKMKKINGYLVVRFNDREKREYEGTGLGNYGVIDAELYTGVLDVDRGVMEYDSAETLAEAVEQARGLESELDIVEPEAVVTVIVEREAEVSEETVEPAELFRMEQTRLGGRILDKEYPEIIPSNAAYQLVGYAQALADLGMIERADERFAVPAEWLAEAKRREAATAPIVSSTCQLAKLFQKISHCTAGNPTAPPPRNRFVHLTPERWKGRTAADLYHLGRQLDKDCPENDCEIYRNIFHMAKELDESLDSLGGCTAEVVQRELCSHVREMRRMYFENYAVKKYREAQT